jgi:hypothetical protein
MTIEREPRLKTSRRKGVVVLSMCALASAFPALAQGPGWTVQSTVVTLVVVVNGGINVRLSPDLTNCVAQSGYGPRYASILPTHPGLKELKASLLSAFHTGAPVYLYLSDQNCTVGEMILGQW